VLGSIKDALAEESPAIDAKNSSISYARFQVAGGRMSIGYLTIRMHHPIARGQSWNQVKSEELGREIAIAAVLAASHRQDPGSAGENPDNLENPVIRIDLISKDVPQSLTQPSGSSPAGSPLEKGPAAYRGKQALTNRSEILAGLRTHRPSRTATRSETTEGSLRLRVDTSAPLSDQ